MSLATICEGNPSVTCGFHSQRTSDDFLLTYSEWHELNSQIPSHNDAQRSVHYVYDSTKLPLMPLQWRHNGYDSVSNHQPHDCFLNRLFGRRSKKTSKLRVTGLCAGISPGTGEFPKEMASNAENVSIWWRHHGNDETSPMSKNFVILFNSPILSRA